MHNVSALIGNEKLRKNFVHVSDRRDKIRQVGQIANNISNQQLRLTQVETYSR